MNKLLPWLAVILAALVLSCAPGSVVLKPDPYAAQPSDNGYIASRSVCGASPSMVASFLGQLPPITLAPELFRSSRGLIDMKLPDIASILPEVPVPGGIRFDQIIIKATPWLL